MVTVLVQGPGSRAADGSGPTAALAAMPLLEAPTLARSNALRLILRSFTSNTAVRAIVILPGAVDDFHLIHRDQTLPLMTPANLAEAIAALTNATALRATFESGPGRLLLHTDADRLGTSGRVRVRVEHAGAAERLRGQRGRGLSSVRWMDVQWTTVQPMLRKGLGFAIRPADDSEEAGHFERLNLVAYGVTDLDLLEAVALATGTQAVIERRRIRFERP